MIINSEFTVLFRKHNCNPEYRNSVKTISVSEIDGEMFLVINRHELILVEQLADFHVTLRSTYDDES